MSVQTDCEMLSVQAMESYARKYNISGKQLEDALSEVGIVVNKNAIKDDPRPKSETSGIRLGTAAITTRGMTEDNAAWIAHQICHMIDILIDEYDYEGIDWHKEIFEETVFDFDT